jgi:hypothetical protein
MPAGERDRIRNLIRTRPWAKTEHERILAEAEKGNGFWAGFLYALNGDAKYLDAAREYLTGSLGAESWQVRNYAQRMADQYLATSAREVFEGVEQTRVLMLTGEYTRASKSSINWRRWRSAVRGVRRPCLPRRTNRAPVRGNRRFAAWKSLPSRGRPC